MAIREDKNKLVTGSFQVDDQPLTADTDVTLGVSTSQFALLGQRHVLQDNMRDTLYGAVRGGDAVTVGELTGDHPDVSRPDPSGVTTLMTETAQNRDAEDREQRQRNWVTEASSFLGAGDGFKPGDTRLLMMLNNPFLAFAADKLLSLPLAATVDEAIAAGDYARASALRSSEIARDKAEGINEDGTARALHRKPGRAGGAYADDTAVTTTPHFENGMYYDSHGGRYDTYGYQFKDGSYKDVDNNFYDARTNTITAGDTHAKIDIPAGLHETGEDILRKTHERLDGVTATTAHALTAANTHVAGGPPSRTSNADAHPQPGSQWAHKVVTEAEIRKTIALEQAAQAEREAQFQTAAHGGTSALHAVSVDEAQAKVGFVHKGPAAPAVSKTSPAAGTGTTTTTTAAAAPAVGPSATDATWYSDGKGGYFDNLGGYYDTKGGYWDAKGGYTDAKGGFTDPKGGYTWPDKSFLDANFNYVDKAGNLTTAKGDYYKARPGEDFKAELQAAAISGKPWSPPAMAEGDVQAAWRTPATPVSAVSTDAAPLIPSVAVTPPTITLPPAITSIATSTVLDANRITPISIPASASPLSSNILSGIDLTNFQMTTPAPDVGSNFTLFNGFRDDFDVTPKTGKFVTALTPLALPADIATPPASTAATVAPKAAPIPAPKAT